MASASLAAVYECEHLRHLVIAPRQLRNFSFYELRAPSKWLDGRDKLLVGADQGSWNAVND